MESQKDKSELILENINSYAKKQNIVVAMKDEINCAKKLQYFLDGGLKSFQVISDFDSTLSRYELNGKLNPTCHGVFETDPEISEDFKKQYKDLFQYYSPIEIDTHKTRDEKSPYMLEWWNKAHQLIVSSCLRRSGLKDTVDNCNLQLRVAADEFMKKLETCDVPLLLFSAGIGDVIKQVLRNNDLLLNNVKIVSNFMEFDNEDIISGFNREVIHSFNKTVYSIQDTECCRNLCQTRKNVLLLGDSPGDPHMSDGLNNHNKLKIGYLNIDSPPLMEQYCDMYDIVIVSDETFTVPLIILEAVKSA